LTQTAPPLRQGVSVEMAVTNNATPMPAADNEDAWIVAVTADGNLYFGIDPVTLEALADKMRRTPRNREAKLYIKADARAPFDTVEKVLEIARDSFFEAPVLLTSQPQAPTPGTLVPPKGLEVLVGPHPSAGAPVVQVTAQPSSQVKVNNRDTALASLQSTLKQLLQGRSEKLVLVNADGPVAFAHVAQVIDISRSTGAKVVIATPEP
jgi:biopolymer transport protein ExbD